MKKLCKSGGAVCILYTLPFTTPLNENFYFINETFKAPHKDRQYITVAASYRRQE